MKLNSKAFGLACGVVWGLGLFFLTWWVILFEGTSASPMFFSRLYLGYTITPLGSIIGLVWGFFDGWIGGLIFAWVYNALVDWIAKNHRAG
jgi:hypothetical protein